VRPVHVSVDSHLRLDGNSIGHDLATSILDDLEVPNPEYDYAKQAERYGWWDLSEAFQLGELDGDELVLPRGYALDLKRRLRAEGIKVKWIDNTRWERGEPYGREEFEFRPHQPRVLKKVRRHRIGIYKAPTGSGKTVAFLGFLWYWHPEYALILVDRAALLHQWQKQIRKHIGDDVDVGIVGQGEWTVGRITIATLQSLHKARKNDDDRYWDLIRRQSFVLMDECHHATAETYNTVVSDVEARYRVGTSATPDKSPAYPIALHTLGPIFHEDDEDELRAMGVIDKPHVEVLHTLFDYPYWGDHRVDADEECDKPGCKKSGKVAHGHRNNYGDMKAALVSDADRNEMIVRNVLDQAEDGYHHQLVISNEVRHLDALVGIFDSLGVKTYKITGKDNRKREAIITEIEAQEEAIILSTVAGEGLDIPIIDRVHLIFPTGNPRKTEQEVGRGTRVHESKGDTIIFDYADTEIPVLAKQFRKRRWQCYEKLGLEVVIR
jgi:superfamily II DNA or RNA helicase